MTIPEHLLPERARELAEVVGIDGLVKLVEWRGGVFINVPVEYSPEHELAGVLGETATRALIDAYAGCRVELPLLTTHARALKVATAQSMRTDGVVIWKIARHLGTTERNTYRWLSRADANQDQMELFS